MTVKKVDCEIHELVNALFVFKCCSGDKQFISIKNLKQGLF